MAANPNLPNYPDIPPRRPKDDHAKVDLIKQSKFPWPIVAFIIGLVILAAIVLYIALPTHLTRPPAGSVVPAQPTGQQIQLTNINMVAGPVGGALYVEAVLHNTGNSEIIGVQVEGVFLGNNGQSLETETGTVQALMQGGGAEDLTQAPIKPHESRPVRIYFNHMPQGWNHEPPQLRVTTVSGTTP